MEQNVLCVNRTQKVLSLPPKMKKGKRNLEVTFAISSKQVALCHLIDLSKHG